MASTATAVCSSDILTRFSDYLHRQVKHAPEQEAIGFDNRRLPYREPEEFARAPLCLGASKGDRVAVSSAPPSKFLLLLSATAGIGAIWVEVNSKYSLREHRHSVENANIKLLLAIWAFKNRILRHRGASVRT